MVMLFEVLFPILALVLLGYGVSRLGWLSANHSDLIAKLIFVTVLPLFLFINAATAEFPTEMPWPFLSAYYMAVMLVYLVGIVISNKVYGHNSAEQSTFGMGSSYSNIVIVGIPVCVMVLSEESLLPLFVLVAIHNFVLFCLGFIFAEHTATAGASLTARLLQVFKQLFTSPIILSLFAGCLFNLAGFTISDSLLVVLSPVGKAAIPAALFILGTSLYQYKVTGSLDQVAVMVLLKMLLLPLLVALFMFTVFTIDPLWATTAVFIAAMPVGINVYMFAQYYQACQAQVAAGIVVSTLLSAVTLSVLSLYFGAIN